MDGIYNVNQGWFCSTHGEGSFPVARTQGLHLIAYFVQERWFGYFFLLTSRKLTVGSLEGQHHGMDKTGVSEAWGCLSEESRV
jgi:hypothetical protein